MADIVERMSTSAAPTALCAHCGRPIIGTPMRMGGAGDVYHAECTLPPRAVTLEAETVRLEADNARLRESVRRLLAICECEIGRQETERRMEAFDD